MDDEAKREYDRARQHYAGVGGDEEGDFEMSDDDDDDDDDEEEEANATTTQGEEFPAITYTLNAILLLQ